MLNALSLSVLYPFSILLLLSSLASWISSFFSKTRRRSSLLGQSVLGAFLVFFFNLMYAGQSPGGMGSIFLSGLKSSVYLASLLFLCISANTLIFYSANQQTLMLRKISLLGLSALFSLGIFFILIRGILFVTFFHHNIFNKNLAGVMNSNYIENVFEGQCYDKGVYMKIDGKGNLIYLCPDFNTLFPLKAAPRSIPSPLLNIVKESGYLVQLQALNPIWRDVSPGSAL